LIDELIAPSGSKLTYTLYGLNRKTELPITFTIPANSIEKIPRAIVSVFNLKIQISLCGSDFFVAKFGIAIRSFPYRRYYQVI